jgi:hypothetical protein
VDSAGKSSNMAVAFLSLALAEAVGVALSMLAWSCPACLFALEMKGPFIVGSTTYSSQGSMQRLGVRALRQ